MLPALFGLAVMTGAGGALAQGAYPTRPVRVVIPYAPGGSSDAIARILGQQLSAKIGRTHV